MAIPQDQPIFITNFTGQAENPHVGFGAAVGLDLYTVKGVARLSRKMVKTSASIVTDFPQYVTEDNQGVIYVQGDGGKIYRSTDNGSTWAVLAGNSGGPGKGLVVWENYLFSATATNIDLYGPLDGVSAWINGWWTSGGGANQPALVNKVGVEHVMFVNIANNFLYICNENYIASVQKLSTPFIPGTGSTFLANDKKFQMPAFYNATTIGFLPPSSTAIAVKNRLNNSQADIVIWNGIADTTAINVVSIPGAYGPVKQLLTRNGVLYGVTDIEHGAYTINGSSAQNIDRLSLRMSNRFAGGAVTTTRLASTIYPHGADFLGPELLTGSSSYPAPVTETATTGLFPYGVWSINIENKVVGTRFPLSHGSINADYSFNHSIGFVKVLTNGRVIVGWQRSNVFGIDTLSDTDCITDAATTFIESEYFEVGTRTESRTFDNLEFNLVQPLLAEQEIVFYFRQSLADDYVAITGGTINNANSTIGTGELSYIITPLNFERSRYIQIAMTAKAGTAANLTPQIRSVILN